MIFEVVMRFYEICEFLRVDFLMRNIFKRVIFFNGKIVSFY